jgi:hypothetical protein
MRQRLTRRLCKLLLCIGLAVAAEPSFCQQAELDGSEQARYLADLKALYLTADERAALIAHSNALLDTYALRAAYQVGQPERRDLRYQVSVSAPGELSLREESRAQKGMSVAVSNRPLNVFGIDPFLRYDCPPSGIVCVLKNPLDGSPWISLVRDQNGAAEVAKALSFLIRNVQKN